MNRSFAELCQIRSLIIEKDSGQYSYPELYLSRSNSRITTAYQLDCNAVRHARKILKYDAGKKPLIRAKRDTRL